MNEGSILILGEADAGKTHYGAQLMIRLEGGKGIARYFQPPENIEPFADAMRNLNNGKSAGHTSGQTTKQTVLHIEFTDGTRANVAWPEYAGERIKDLVQTRLAGDVWRKASAESSGWLLMLRHDAFKIERDLLNKPVSEWMDKRKKAENSLHDWVPQARAIELLQMMIFLRQTAKRDANQGPRLAIALSCYDTLPEREKFANPSVALRAFAPLVSDFVESNWDTEDILIVGLSSTGKTLDKAKSDVEFVDSGPSANGWIIKPDGSLTHDLTWPIAELLSAR